LWVLPAAFAPVLSGGSATFMTVCYRFLGITSLKKDRPIRRMLCQFGLVGGAALGAFGGGYLLHPNNLQHAHTVIRTYYVNFSASLLINAICVPVLIVALRRGERMIVLVKKEEAEDLEPEMSQQKTDPEAIKQSLVPGTAQKDFRRGFFYELFDVDNIKSTWNCLTLPRPHRINFSIYSIYGCYYLLYFVYIGLDTVSLQFCEKVYNWNAKQYATVLAIYRIVLTLVVFGSVLILVKKYLVDNSKLIAISTAISSAAHFLVGVILRDVVYFANMPFSKSLLIFLSLLI